MTLHINPSTHLCMETGTNFDVQRDPNFGGSMSIAFFLFFGREVEGTRKGRPLVLPALGGSPTLSVCLSVLQLVPCPAFLPQRQRHPGLCKGFPQSLLTWLCGGEAPVPPQNNTCCVSRSLSRSKHSEHQSRIHRRALGEEAQALGLGAGGAGSHRLGFVRAIII